MIDPNSLPYRPCAGIMLINEDDKVFVGQRIDMPSEHWQMPQGGIDDGEDPLSAAKRELLEEIGTDKAELLLEMEDWVYYDLPHELIGKVWKGRYRGQKQRWFLFQFTGSDADIDIETEHPEFSKWKWTEIKTLVPEIVPFKQDIYQKVVDRFEQFISDSK
ncbi:MAG: RNA pyrophosphohydrolase [Sneathiella sp.]|nr:RNA pyrophosphohydrolase [Sneathiella sp.]